MPETNANSQINDLLGRIQAVELELQFSKKELDETRELYKKLENLFRDSEQMIGRLSTLISVQEEVIKHLQNTVSQKASGNTTDIVTMKEDIKDMKAAIQELDRFKFKAVGMAIVIAAIVSVVSSYLLTIV